MLPRTEELIRRALESLQDFLRLEAAGGLVLMGAAVLAMLVANSPLAAGYDGFINLPVQVSAGALGIAKPLIHWINDGLMAVFFLLVGLELKREVMEGELANLRDAALPLFAAVGGMAAPAAIYVWLNWGDAAALKGWAIPSATDIAFALGVLMLLGDRVPPALKAFLLSVAIFDDVGAVIVIAAFYTSGLSITALSIAGGLLLLLWALNRAGVARRAAYVLVGIPLWFALLKSGVHATLAGFLLAWFVPLRAPGPGATSPLHDFERALHPWVAFGVLPLFAFANAGVPLAGVNASQLLHPVSIGIVGGLVIGKPVGILALSWLAVRLRLATLPGGVGWGLLAGASLLCGIGFTMSLFIASLAFEQGGGAYLGLERIGILSGSLVAGAAGWLLLRRMLRDA
ncbi:MAG TPA: Na+/H+ antiporter NhaA [Steroidobacteraceae bacterium]|nr:Na+/H+ antiporter NhaA [Steroidobacteraceae bacterium]